MLGRAAVRRDSACGRAIASARSACESALNRRAEAALAWWHAWESSWLGVAPSGLGAGPPPTRAEPRAEAEPPRDGPRESAPPPAPRGENPKPEAALGGLPPLEQPCSGVVLRASVPGSSGAASAGGHDAIWSSA